MKLQKAGFILFLIITCCYCTNQKNRSVFEADWFLGVWQISGEHENRTYESWTKINENELSGINFKVNGSDTIISETIKLIGDGTTLLYIPQVNGQNNNQPVRFTLKSVSENKIVFENSQHDFPQVIAYNKINPDSLTAEISGIVNGKERKHLFEMSKFTSSN